LSRADNGAKFILVGSTPGDSLIKSVLTIHDPTKVDFIRWDLVLENVGAGSGTFLLNINYGIGKQNTSGFVDGGENKILNGKYTLINKNSKIIYQLNTNNQTIIFLVKLNENIFHLLTPDHKLMVGNGGWSYTLNRKTPVSTTGFSTLTTSKEITDISPESVFEGRTPCQPLASDHPELKADPDCFKLKWRLILHRDSVSQLPKTYTIRKIVNNEPQDGSGKWTISYGTSSNPDAVIYRLDPDNPKESVSFLAGDENVLFFIDKKNIPYVGNSDFSYTLNKK
jgi:hypothetical protein